MKSFFLAITLLFPPSSFAQDDLRTLTDVDLKELSLKVSKSLHHCKQLKKGADVTVTLKNATSDFIDKAIVADALTSFLKPAAPGPGKKYEIRATISSQAEEKSHIYKAVYKLTAAVFQGEEQFCEKSGELVKTGKIP